MDDDSRELSEVRGYKVVKANDLIQKSRFSLQLQEQKVILYLISKIKREDLELKEHEFDIRDFCRVCGAGVDSGANYKDIRKTLKDLRDKSIWVTLPNGAETTLAWLDKVTISPNSGKVIIRFDDLLKPYLLQLQGKYTQYELLYTLAMKSQYSIRLYELLKSYENLGKKLFYIEELKTRLSAENYARYPDFKRKVLDISIREINAVSDLNITYTLAKQGRKFVDIEFIIKAKIDLEERLEMIAQIDAVISPDKVTLRDRIENAEQKKTQG